MNVFKENKAEPTIGYNDIGNAFDMSMDVIKNATPHRSLSTSQRQQQSTAFPSDSNSSYNSHRHVTYDPQIDRRTMSMNEQMESSRPLRPPPSAFITQREENEVEARLLSPQPVQSDSPPKVSVTRHFETKPKAVNVMANKQPKVNQPAARTKKR